MDIKPSKPIAAGLAITLATAVAVPSLTSAQSPPATTLTFQEKVRGVVTDDVAPKSSSGQVSLGDRLVTRQALFGTGGKPAGTLLTDCSGAGPTAAFEAATLQCTVTYRLAGGQVVAAGAFRLDGSGELAIVGGTGAYAGARGTVKSGRPAKGFDSADVLTIDG